MSDVLDISSTVEFEVDEVGDRGINRLKVNARKRKGRGIEGYYDTNFNTNKFNDNDNTMREIPEYWENIPTVPKKNVIEKKRDDNKLYDEEIPQKSIEGWVLFITGIHEEANEDEISDKFSEVAKIRNIRTNLDRRTGFMKNYAIIEYGSYKDAHQTKEKLNGSEFLGMKVEVNWCFIKAPEKYMRNKK